METSLPSFLGSTTLLFAGATLAPLLIVTMTGFIKISVVLFVLRNASGLQQTPANIVLNTIALVLVIFIQMPLAVEAYESVSALGIQMEDQARWPEAFAVGFEPFQRFMMHFTTDIDRAFFLNLGEQMYSNTNINLSDGSIFVLLPAFVVAELSAAFEIGVLIFLPFLAVDVVVTNLLTALGMNMMTPTVISLPFKLLLFVSVDGWSRLTHALVLSYLQV